MMLFRKAWVFCLFVLMASRSFAVSPQSLWEVGLSVGRPAPWSVHLAFEPPWLVCQTGWGGWLENRDNWWSAGHVYLGYPWIRHSQYRLDLGWYGSYSYFQAYDAMAGQLNRLMGQKFLNELQYQENVQMGPALCFHWFGAYFLAAYPLFQRLDHQEGWSFRAGIAHSFDFSWPF